MLLTGAKQDTFHNDGGMALRNHTCLDERAWSSFKAVPLGKLGCNQARPKSALDLWLTTPTEANNADSHQRNTNTVAMMRTKLNVISGCRLH
jgi:hypothetical protein